jgi:NADP-dependent 3-hydroxy acid dehydrogenase YdfG
VLQRNTSLVTGASSGIGRATAERLACEPGAQLVLVARREDLLSTLAEALPCPATSVAVDLTDADAPERVRAHVAERHGHLDLLVNNAGASWRGTFAEGGHANVDRHMRLNFDAVVRLTEALLPLLRDSAPSSIVYVASTDGSVAWARTGLRIVLLASTFFLQIGSTAVTYSARVGSPSASADAATASVAARTKMAVVSAFNKSPLQEHSLEDKGA